MGTLFSYDLQSHLWLTIGEGLFVDESWLPGAGLGLYAAKEFKAGEIITGVHVTFEKHFWEVHMDALLNDVHKTLLV